MLNANSWMSVFDMDLIKCLRLEIIVTYSGASASTGQVTEEKTSYLSREIEWGHRFLNMVEYDEVKREYFIDYDKFDITMQVINI